MGTFVSFNTDGLKETVKLYWLENAYLVREKGLLKIKFLHSEEIKKEVSVRKHGGKRRNLGAVAFVQRTDNMDMLGAQSTRIHWQPGEKPDKEPSREFE